MHVVSAKVGRQVFVRRWVHVPWADGADDAEGRVARCHDFVIVLNALFRDGELEVVAEEERDGFDLDGCELALCMSRQRLCFPMAL